MYVRREMPVDEPTVRITHVEAFRREPHEEPAEAKLLDELRAGDRWLPQFSIVATIDDVVVGHVVCTRAHIDAWPVLGLGPIAVRPDLQRGGIGLAMMHAIIGAADATDEPLIALLGSPDYYGRFGFVASSRVGVVPPKSEWGDAFQVRTLSAHRSEIRGLFAYPAPFDNV